MDTAKLPAYSGVEDPQRGYTLVRITRAVDPEKIDPEKEKSLTTALQQALGREQFAAYIASLKQKAEVKIKQESLMEKKDK